MGNKKIRCYLCGKSIQSKSERSDDHCPPRQLFPKSLRKAMASRNLSPNLITLPAHKTCNSDYKSDEDYFALSLGASPADTASQELMHRDIRKAASNPGMRKLFRRVVSEFSNVTPAGLTLPSGSFVKTYDPPRVRRIAWKVVRGLFYHEKGRILPQVSPHIVDMLSDNSSSTLRDVLEAVVDEPTRGEWQGVFSYKLYEGSGLLVWALLFLDKFIFVGFHPDPQSQEGIEFFRLMDSERARKGYSPISQDYVK